MSLRRAIFALSAAAAVAAVAYGRFLRPWHLRWGASDEEVAARMPLDELVSDATVVSTRAVGIHASPAQVWPWLVQMGDAPRAGYYSYAIIEKLQGMKIENADRILPEYQSLQAGEVLDPRGNMYVHAVDPGRSLVLGPPPSIDWMACTWAFVLQPQPDGTTRLVTRVRARFNPLAVLSHTPPLAWPFWLVIDPGVFIMERKMLLEIKRLAEAGVAGANAEAGQASPRIAHTSGG